MIGVPPRDTFHSLTSLENLNIEMTGKEVDVHQPCIDLSRLQNLKELGLDGGYRNCDIELMVPTLIKILVLMSPYITISSNCTMPLLDKFYVRQCLLIHGLLGQLVLPASITHQTETNCQHFSSTCLTSTTFEKTGLECPRTAN
ncbi:hypothetical protein DFA_02398 [Cavenderia fasciculata]|uniref:Uncharacterized protein n=1 Tax=Cavenderia fasciculata TaxID=261658 RepID=F4PZC2_CACFS|nr:uncharacterized protein DFA_02398 [Cavenderia fasciculata]EGG19151.1 hypothetical protein DFA_02398 [Cavenderia fasciculata]|eukprot:XP_004366784.1 hypothetical protein DFA_02398 [Cavenderia fasciculata]